MNGSTDIMPGLRDPVPVLLATGDSALAYFVRRDLLEEPVGPASALWERPEP